MFEIFLSATLLVWAIVVGIWVVHELELSLPRLWRKKPKPEPDKLTINFAGDAVRQARFEARFNELHRAYAALQQENEQLRARLRDELA